MIILDVTDLNYCLILCSPCRLLLLAHQARQFVFMINVTFSLLRLSELEYTISCNLAVYLPPLG